ncbi:(2Fe-2S)-binding protein [Dehalobacter restrictus]|jgi:carbon-monoxide dehydrogenase small subunit|uniref:Ferredoxin n=1 Tax=Dehalobacter restrictus (strain DSM 9455 / PER-K23) TaxID=871738 RepID=A0ABM5P7B3_DEHRP|nr:(2Fe-2S)-binding protein [Dehalobacter restrictus]AHF10464.1 ferredoxin [Dehalobacter restrictus DSM 9455]
MQHIINFTLNGEKVEALVKDNLTLLDFIRGTIGLTGTKKGCEEGECGACTVLLNGKPVNSCLVIAREVEGKDVITVEGIAQNGQLSPLQRQFIDKWALQCGYCTPGMIMSAKALLDANPNPTEDEIRDAIAGNLCRCTGYAKIVEAIQATAKEMDWGVK